jgi:hypothetical protein
MVDEDERGGTDVIGVAWSGPICPFGDPFCPCQDGGPGSLACHYVDLPGSPAMAPPTDGERAAWARALADIESRREKV